MRTPRIPQSSSSRKKSTCLLLCLLSILTAEVHSASLQTVAASTPSPLSPSPYHQTSNHIINDDDGAIATAISTAHTVAAAAAAAAHNIHYAAHAGTGGGNGGGSSSSEVCPNRPFADARSDVIRYPMCLRQPGWSAAMMPTPSYRVGAADDGGGKIYENTDNIKNNNSDNKDSGDSGRNNSSSTVSPSKQTDAEIPTSSTSTTQQQQQQQQQQPRSIPLEDSDDSDSALDNSNFLSFEEWREQNLAKIGQSTDNVARKKDSRAPRRPPNIRNNLESIGDEGEIDLDFAGLVPDMNTAAAAAAWDRSSSSHQNPVGGERVANGHDLHSAGSNAHADELDEHVQPGLTRRKNAGVTCKERSNYASFDCAATVLKTNREGSGASAVLVENKDSYMLNECRAQNKFIILELCDDILIDTIVLANFEFFSSRFRTFRVSVSDRYPPKPDKWKDLGIFEALNTREIQAFPVENPLIWARYVKIEFLTHYGSEFYCPLSLIRVHGTTMMEEFKSEGENNRADDTMEEHDVALSELEPEGITVVDAAVANNDTAEEEKDKPFEQPAAHLEEIEIVLPETAEDLEFPLIEDFGDVCWTRGSEVERLLLYDGNEDISHICGMEDFPTPTSDGTKDDMKALNVEDFRTSAAASTKVDGGHSVSERSAPATAATATKTPSYAAARDRSSQATNTISTKTVVVDADHSALASETTKTLKPSNQQSIQSASVASSSSSSSLVAPATPSPTTQESFFKSMNKRLQMLEMNSTLSLLYIGEQSRILREAFNKVEKRQLGKTTAFLENLNHTVLTELHDFRQQYDQVWQSVIMEFEQQRLQYNREVFAVTRQLGVLADEILFQKRLSLIQSIFVLILFGIVLFSRDTVRRYLELPPRVQGMLGRGGGGWGSPGLRTSWHRYPFSFPLRSPSQSPMSVPGSPVSDGVAHDQGPGTDHAIDDDGGSDIHHRRSSPSMDSRSNDDNMVPDSEQIYPVANRPSSPPASHHSPSSSVSSSASASAVSSSSSSSARSFVQGEPGPGLEDGKGQGLVSGEGAVEIKPSLPTDFQSRDTGVAAATGWQGMAEGSGNRQRLPLHREEDEDNVVKSP